MAKEELLFLDELSDVYSRRYLKEVKNRIIPSLLKDEIPFSVSIADLDHFKEINDIFGHRKGDEAIKSFATFLKENLRSDDIIIRYGGDEFVIVQKGLNSKDAYVIWERLVKKLKSMEFSGLKLSMSVGIANYPGDGDDFDTLFEIADANLYQAKRTGRGRVGLKGSKRIKIPPVRFVDRIDAIDKLLENIERGVISLVVGEAGGGKTRLIKEVLSNLREREVLWSDCLALERKISYYPLRELVKYKLKRAGVDFADKIPIAYRIEIGKIVPEILSESDENIDLYGKTLDRYRLFEGFNIFFNTGDKNRVIVIDNIQWADEDSLEALRYIIRNRKPQNAFIFAIRKEEKTDYLEDFLQNLSREHEVVEVPLYPLEEKYMREVVRIIVGESIRRLEDYVIEKSAGNVFYAEELIKTLVEKDYLVLDENTWQFKEPPEDISPRGVEDVVKRKFNRLSEGAKELARVLSVARKGYIDLLLDLFGFNEGELFGLIDEGIRSGLFIESEDEEFVQYRSELLRQVVYNDEVSILKKKRYHKKVAEWLDKNKRYGNEEELAYHYMKAQIDDKAVEYGIKAGKKSASLYATRDALKYYGWVLDILEKYDDIDKKKQYVEVLLEQAFLEEKAGMFNAAKSSLNKAIEIADNAGFIKEKAEALSGMGGLSWKMGRIEKALEFVKEAISLCTSHGLTKELAGAYNNLGILYSTMGDFEKSLEAYKKALSIREDDAAFEGRIYNNMGLVYNYMEEFDKAREYFTKARDIFDKSGIKRGYMIATANLGLVYNNQAQYSRALEYYQRAFEVAEEIGDVLSRAHILDNIGVVYMRLGKFDKARANMSEALRIVKSVGKAKLEGNIYNNLGLIYDSMCDYKKALEFFIKSFEIAKKNSEKRSMVIRGSNVAGIYIVLSEYNEAEKWLNDVYRIAKELKVPGVILHVINVYMTYLLETRQYEKAKNLIEEGEEYVSSVKGSARFEFLLNRFRLMFKLGEFEKADKMIPVLENELAKIDFPEEKIDFYLSLIEYYIERKFPEKAEKYALLVHEDFKNYYDRSKVGLYFVLRGKIAKMQGQEDAGSWFRKAKETYESIGLLKRFEELIKEYSHE